MAGRRGLRLSGACCQCATADGFPLCAGSHGSRQVDTQSGTIAHTPLSGAESIMKKPSEHPSPDRADTATIDASQGPRAVPSRRRPPTPPAPGTAAAAFLAGLNAAYGDDQDPDDEALPRAMRPHMRRVLERDR